MRVIHVLILGAVGMALVISTAARVRVFSDPDRLWADAAEQSPEKPRVWVNLGRQYALRNNSAEAANAYQKAIRLAENRRVFDEEHAAVGFAQANLALLRFTQGDTNTARVLMAQAVDRLPGDHRIKALAAWVNAGGLSR